MELIIKYWPLLLILVLFVCVIIFLIKVQKNEKVALNILRDYCNKIDKNEADIFRKILIKNIGYYFILNLISGITISIFIFLFLGKNIMLLICFIIVTISYLSTFFSLIKFYRTKSPIYKVNVKDVETKVVYIRPDIDSRSSIKCYFYIRNKKEEYSTENVYLLFNNLIDSFIKKSGIGECYMVDNVLLYLLK